MSAKNNPNEIRIVRLYDAPVSAVWDAWTDSDQVAQWWGPRGFTITTHSKDLRPGGRWLYTMHGPDGVDFPNTTTYLEVETHKRLVYDHGADIDRPPLFRVTVEFTAIRGRTRIDMSMALATAEAAEQTRAVIKKFGGYSTWDRLAEYLGKEATGTEKFVINRTFDAALDRVFEMWADRAQLPEWLPPPGFRMRFLKADIRQSGSTFYVMENSSLKMFGKAEYLQIEKPRRLVYTQQFCDEHGSLSRHPMSPTWPATMLITVELAEEGPNLTRVTVTAEPYGPTTSEEVATFVKGRTGMTQGFTASFDTLEEHLKLSTH